jgi:hypothetical protein
MPVGPGHRDFIAATEQLSLTRYETNTSRMIAVDQVTGQMELDKIDEPEQ